MNNLIVMADVYDRIFQNLSERLQDEEDRQLLKNIIDVQRKEGVNGVKHYLEQELQRITE